MNTQSTSNIDEQDWQTCLTADGHETTTYFGCCPICGRNDGYMNIGKGHWFYCKEHKVKWCVGANLFSSWQHETEGEQRDKFDRLGFGEFEKVEPWCDLRWIEGTG